MRALSKLLFLQAFVAVLSLAQARNGFFSAMCIIFQERCPIGMQNESEGCKPVPMVQQARQCLEAACTYCGSLANQFPCLRTEIRQVCDGSQVRSTLVLSAPATIPAEPVTSAPTPMPMQVVATPTPMTMEPMVVTPTPMAMEPAVVTPTPMAMENVVNTPSPMAMEPMMAMATPTPMTPGVAPSPPVSPMGDLDTIIGGGESPVTDVDPFNSEQPAEPSPEMTTEDSMLPDAMSTSDPIATPMYTPKPGEISMMDDEATMPSMMNETAMPPTTMPDTTSTTTESSTTTTPPTTMPPATEPPTTEPPTTMAPMSDSDPSGCTYTGTDRVTISLGSVTPADGWVRKNRDGMSGLVFRPDKNHGILKPGLEGVMCFAVRLEIPGDYHLTAVSAAPDRTENNDMWIKSSKPLTLIRNGVVQNGNTDWYKGYQNDGGNKIADHLKTVDNRGHDFVVTNVRANENFNICISGRSYRYEVFKIILNQCGSARCLSGSSPRGSLLDSTPSLCS
ncbi:unnamed protein product [Agarophyton chilense]